MKTSRTPKKPSKDKHSKFSIMKKKLQLKDKGHAIVSKQEAVVADKLPVDYESAPKVPDAEGNVVAPTAVDDEAQPELLPIKTKNQVAVSF
jgi:hypothetical protein